MIESYIRYSGPRGVRRLITVYLLCSISSSLWLPLVAELPQFPQLSYIYLFYIYLYFLLVYKKQRQLRQLRQKAFIYHVFSVAALVVVRQLRQLFSVKRKVFLLFEGDFLKFGCFVVTSLHSIIPAFLFADRQPPGNGIPHDVVYCSDV